jgi:hypothetical protein
MSTGLVAFCGFVVAFGMPAYYVVKKKRASDSLNKLLAERFTERPCPVNELHTKLGTIYFFGAYNDTGGSGLVLVLGNLFRSPKAYLRIAGVFKPSGNLQTVQPTNGGDVVVTADIAGGSLIMWKGLPSRDSVLAHMQSVR